MIYYYILSTYSLGNCLEFSLENLYADIAWGLKGYTGLIVIKFLLPSSTRTSQEAKQSINIDPSLRK